MSTRGVQSVRQRRNADMAQRRAESGHAIAQPRSIGYYGANQDPVQLAELTTKARKKLPTSTFAIPEDRAYPIPDEAHARNALARVSQFGTPEEQSRVRAAVKRKFPNIGKAKPAKGGNTK